MAEKMSDEMLIVRRIRKELDGLPTPRARLRVFGYIFDLLREARDAEPARDTEPAQATLPLNGASDPDPFGGM